MWGRFRRYFISGLVVFLPVGLTIYLFMLTLKFLDGLLGKYIEPYFYQFFGFYLPGLGIIVGLVSIWLIGFMATNFFGRKLHSFFERLLIKLPFFRQVYPAFKEMALFLFSNERLQFKQVVLVEYPRKGIWSMGFLTNDSPQMFRDETHQELCNVFIPSAPGPLTGYIVFVPRKDIILSDITVEHAVKLIVSGGVVNPF